MTHVDLNFDSLGFILKSLAPDSERAPIGINPFQQLSKCRVVFSQRSTRLLQAPHTSETCAKRYQEACPGEHESGTESGRRSANCEI